MSLNFEATFRPMVKEVAKSVTRNFPRNILVEDCEQNLWLWLYQNKKSIENTMDTYPAAWIEMIAGTMRKVAFTWGSQERASIEGRDPVDHQRYSLKEVRALLPDVFDYEDWQSFTSFGDGQPRGKSQANTTGDRLAALVDVKTALEKVTDDQYNILVWHFKYQDSHDRLAERYECSVPAAKKRVERALKAVQRGLGTDVPEEYTGRRSVRSNAAWRAASDNYYQEN